MLEHALEGYPSLFSRSLALQNLAELYCRSGNYDQSRRHCREAAQLALDRPQVNIDYFESCLLSGAFDEALQVAQRIDEDLPPDHPCVSFNQAALRRRSELRRTRPSSTLTSQLAEQLGPISLSFLAAIGGQPHQSNGIDGPDCP